MEVKLRAHHFLCTLCFEGKGYSQQFVDNYNNIIKYLNDKNPLIRLVNGLDDVCKYCPKIENARCIDHIATEKLDHNVLKILEFNIGEIRYWEEWKIKIKQILTHDRFHIICKNCSWKELGICEKTLKTQNFI